jgi:hypothetical protein
LALLLSRDDGLRFCGMVVDRAESKSTWGIGFEK